LELGLDYYLAQGGPDSDYQSDYQFQYQEEHKYLVAGVGEE